jgi:hypothetical protein
VAKSSGSAGAGGSVVAALVLVVAGAAIAAARGSHVAEASGPGVLIVTIDTLRRDHVSIYGETAIHTPTFEDLAAQGVTFLDASRHSRRPRPAHAALFTGRHPIRNGVLSNGSRLANGYETLAETLRDKGYATAAFVSSIAVDSRTGLDQGFDVYDDDFTPQLRGLSEILLPRAALALALRSGGPCSWTVRRLTRSRAHSRGIRRRRDRRSSGSISSSRTRPTSRTGCLDSTTTVRPKHRASITARSSATSRTRVHGG